MTPDLPAFEQLVYTYDPEWLELENPYDYNSAKVPRCGVNMRYACTDGTTHDHWRWGEPTLWWPLPETPAIPGAQALLDSVSAESDS